MRLIYSSVPILTVLLACGVESVETGNTHPVHGANHAHVCTLTVIDSIGVELGDSNYVFGALGEVDIGPNGDIFVVDWMKCTIFRYSPDGTFVQRIGRRGSGPGELLQPFFIAVMDDGSISLDDGELGWMRFDSTGEIVCTSMYLGRAPRPWFFVAADSLNIIGMLSELSREDTFLLTDKQICRWHADSPDSVITEYYSRQYSIEIGNDYLLNMNDMIKIDYFPMLFTAGDGFVCIAPEPRTEPLLLLFHEDGSVMDTLNLPYPEVVRTEEEILERKQYVEELFYARSRHTHQVEWEPFPNKPMISDLGVDSLNRIWVQRGFEQFPVFDLYDISGEHLMTAVLPGRDD
ncbi:MAG: 6-bladed beta-propeller, partial [Candidatus Sabulitectum sp.]|nr:6-bladed beta-propeller [Candidatus Sabulitectum sp.]